MTGPKHLWSGDWESESARAADNLASAPPLVFETEPDAPEPRVARARRWSRRQIAVALTAGVAAAAVTVGLVTALDGTAKPRPQRHAAAPAARTHNPTGGASPTTKCQQTPGGCTPATPVVAGPTADWLGMQIVSSPSGIVVSTVRLGSLADQAGFEPGDQIEEIDGHPVDSLDRVRDVTAGITLGKPVSIQILRASVILQAASLPMVDRPTIHP